MSSDGFDEAACLRRVCERDEAACRVEAEEDLAREMPAARVSKHSGKARPISCSPRGEIQFFRFSR
jgi:hypothetical protein